MTLWPRALSTQAPAKLNLFLDILGRRPDGYHEIETLMLPISLCDELEIIVSHPGSSRVSLSTSGISLDCSPSENLVSRAATLFCTHFRDFDVVINLHKNIPSGAGLGGGSSDAASVLLALNSMMDIDMQLDFDALVALGATLGSDVPFFLYRSAAICKGRGENVTSLDADTLPCTSFLLALPPVHVGTADVYRAWSSGEHVPSPYKGVQDFIGKWQQNTAIQFHNSLEQAALSVSQELRHYASFLDKSTWTMTGSGSAFFAPIGDAGHAERMLAQIPSNLNITTFIVSTWTDNNFG